MSRDTCPTSGRRGFSLVELLVVVAIVGLLAAVTLPGLARAREYAYFTRCKNQLRQMSMGFLTFSADRRGLMPLVDTPCDGRWREGCAKGPQFSRKVGARVNTYVAAKRMANGLLNRTAGGLRSHTFLGGAYWSGRSWSDRDQEKIFLTLVKLVYGGTISVGRKWTGTSHYDGWTGIPRQKGLYLPVDGFWDPIVAVRDWSLWGGSSDINRLMKFDNGQYVTAGTEQGRDHLLRSGSLPGYDFFIYSVGCIKNVHDPRKSWPIYGGSCGYINPGSSDSKAMYEEPFRYATKSRDLSAFHKPSAWVASCIRPTRKYNGVTRAHRSHFGCRSGVPGEWRFNILHLDGHVDDTLWAEWRSLPSNNQSYWVFRQTNNFYAPYGWRYKQTSSPAYYQNVETNLEPIPGFPLPFDENK